ncbi:MAG: error-prone DNA polymerase [Rhodospirillales bacterium]|nr:error-prone DNA polymerase [Rhodospirillales bacterium]
MTYAELQVTTNHSFLRGGSHIEELFAAAAALGLPALGITDRASVGGMVRAHQRAKESGVRLVPGCRIDPTDAPPLLLYPTDRPAWSRLTRLLTVGKRRAGKGGCRLGWDEIQAASEGMLAALIPDDPVTLPGHLDRLREAFADRAYLAFTPTRRPGEVARLERLARLARAHRVAPLGTGDVLYHAPERRILADVLACIREGCTIDTAGFRLDRGAERHLRAPEAMARLLARHPDAIARTAEVVQRCRFSLDDLAYQYPREIEDPSLTPQQTLERLTWQGAAQRYPDGVPDAVTAQLRHELRLIDELAYASYFLTVHSIVRFSRGRGILCQGRGSAANSAVCYVLGITSVDPVRSNLLFERFVSAERREPPDIDVDFEHERREEVIQWILETYGRDRAALCATVIRFRTRGAVREVGKALGLTEDITGVLARQVSIWADGAAIEARAAELNLNLQDRRLRLTLELAETLVGFPRHLSQHPGGFVLTDERLDALVPIEPAAMGERQVIEWDKDDIDSLRFMKVDVLGLGMLGCLRRAFDLLAAQRGIDVDLARIPAEDPTTYAMISRADTLGTFQIESRAQMSMLPRIKPRTFYDLVIQVAIVRPGPIQGDMVHPYLRRRERREPVYYPSPELRRVLERTLGVPLFQEQAMQVAIVCAGFTPGEADALRRSMATFKMTGGVAHFRARLLEGMAARGYPRDFAEQICVQLEGFGSYGFPESHAASFALIAYASAWMKCHHPDVFACALLNAQPMGFYAPAQIVRDARTHGVAVRGVCVNASRWDCTLERDGENKTARFRNDLAEHGRAGGSPHAAPPGALASRLALRLGLRMVKGLAEADAARIVAARGPAPYADVDDLWRRAGVSAGALRALAAADAFAGLGRDRRAALWAIAGLAAPPLPLFTAAATHAPEATEPEVRFAPLPAAGAVMEDYRRTGLSLRGHPVAFLRAGLARDGVIPCAALARARDGARATVAGLVLVRQRPGSARGVLFMTIEDETGFANLIVWPDLFEKQRRLILSAGMLAARGTVQREGTVVHVVVRELTDLSPRLAALDGKLRVATRDFR